MSRRRVTRMITVVANVPIRHVKRSRGRGLGRVNGILGRRIVKRSRTVSGLMHSVHHKHIKLGSPGGPVNTFVFLKPANIKGACLTGGLTRYLFNDTSTLVQVSVDRCVRGRAMDHVINTPPKCVKRSRKKRLARGMHHGPCSVLLLSRLRGTRDSIFGVLLRIVSRKHLASDGNSAVSFGGAVVVVASGYNAHRLGRFNENINFDRDGGGLPTNGKCKHRIVRGTLRGRFTPRFLGQLSSVVRFSRLSLRSVGHVISVRLHPVIHHIGRVNCRLGIRRSTGGFLTRGKCSMRCNTEPLEHTLRACLRSTIYRLVIGRRACRKRALAMTRSNRGLVVARRWVELWALWGVGVVRGNGVKMAARGVFPIVGGFLCDSRRVFVHRVMSGTMSTARGLGALTGGNSFDNRANRLGMDIRIGGRTKAVAIDSHNLNVARRRVSGCVGRVTFSKTGSFLSGCGRSTGTVVNRFNLKFCSSFVIDGGIRVVAGDCGRGTGTMG